MKDFKVSTKTHVEDGQKFTTYRFFSKQTGLECASVLVSQEVDFDFEKGLSDQDREEIKQYVSQEVYLESKRSK